MKKELLDKLRGNNEIVQLDFEHDNKLFVDPYRINENAGELLARAKEKIIKFFDLFFQCIEQNDRKMVKLMGQHLHEINATKLGYANGCTTPTGKGFCEKDLFAIFKEAMKIRDYIEDMPDVLILAENVGPDKVSDLTTNIIYEELLEYTTYIISKYKLEIEFIEKNKWIFDTDNNKWVQKSLLIPHIDNEEILFLPKNIVASHQIFSYEKVYRNLVFPFYKANPQIHKLMRVASNKEKVSNCKKLRKKYPLNRNTVKRFRRKYPEIYEKYKVDTVENLKILIDRV